MDLSKKVNDNGNDDNNNDNDAANVAFFEGD